MVTVVQEHNVSVVFFVKMICFVTVHVICIPSRLRVKGAAAGIYFLYIRLRNKRKAGQIDRCLITLDSFSQFITAIIFISAFAPVKGFHLVIFGKTVMSAVVSYNINVVSH